MVVVIIHLKNKKLYLCGAMLRFLLSSSRSNKKAFTEIFAFLFSVLLINNIFFEPAPMLALLAFYLRHKTYKEIHKTHAIHTIPFKFNALIFFRDPLRDPKTEKH